MCRSGCGLALLLALGAGACGGAEPTASPAAGAPAATDPRSGGPVARPVDSSWIDPEPPEAQAMAEAVVGADWNRDKSTTLTMSITTLVDRTTGLEGFVSRLAARDASLADRLSALGATVTGTEIVIRLSGSVLFDFDRAEIRADAERTLTDVVAVLQAHASRPVRIEGHTDSIAADAYNQRLSESRAAAVRDWLVAHRVEAPRMRTVGLGESRPVADNATAAGRQLNRRVEIVVETGSS